MRVLRLYEEEWDEIIWVLRDSIELLETEIKECLATYEDRSAELAMRKSILSKIEDADTCSGITG